MCDPHNALFRLYVNKIYKLQHNITSPWYRKSDKQLQKILFPKLRPGTIQNGRGEGGGAQRLLNKRPGA